MNVPVYAPVAVLAPMGTEPPTLKASEPADPRAFDKVWLAAEPVRLFEVVTTRVSVPLAIEKEAGTVI